MQLICVYNLDIKSKGLNRLIRNNKLLCQVQVLCEGRRRKRERDKPAKRATVKKAAAKKTAVAKTSAKKASTGKKAGQTTATDQILKIIKRAKSGVDVPTLKKKTGFDDKKVRNIVFRAAKEGRIKKSGRGVYVGA